MDAHNGSTQELAGEGRENLSVRYERQDANALAVTATGAGIVLATFIAVLLMSLLFDHFMSRRGSLAPAHPSRIQKPPQPRLQSSLTADLEALRRREDRALHSYEWLDKDRRAAAIPIDEAIDMIVRRGLPFKSGPRSEVYPPSAGSKETGFP